MPRIKRITNYCNYATWNCDAGERIAPCKSRISNRCDTIWNNYVNEGFAYLYLQPIITQYFIDNKSEIWLLFLIAHSKR